MFFLSPETGCRLANGAAAWGCAVFAAIRGLAVTGRLPIIGHVRFSYYGYTDTRLKPDKTGEALARLYDETRMARRFFLFETLTLPSLLAQTDPDFSILIMSSTVMPEPFRQRLTQIAARLPQAKVVFSGHRRSLLAYDAPMREALGPDQTGYAVHFRLDDDDALARSYIQRLRQQAQGMPPRTHFSFPTGIHLFPAKAGGTVGTSLVVKEFLTAQGLAYVSGDGFLRNPFATLHRQVWLSFPVLLNPDFPCYIRTSHFDNDTVARQDQVLQGRRQTRSGPEAAEHAQAVEAMLADEFPFIDRARLDAVLGDLTAIRGMADLPPVT